MSSKPPDLESDGGTDDSAGLSDEDEELPEEPDWLHLKIKFHWEVQAQNLKMMIVTRKIHVVLSGS